MTTADRDTADAAREGGGAPLELDDRPIQEALAAIDRARVAIEQAKADFRERREAFAAVFQAEMQTRIQTEDRDPSELLGPVVGELYWDHPILRVSDIAAATGLSGEQVRRTAGPRRREVSCRRCGTATEVLQTRRSRPPAALCSDCRVVAGFGEAMTPPSSGPRPPPPDEPPPPDRRASPWQGPATPGDRNGQWYDPW